MSSPHSVPAGSFGAQFRGPLGVVFFTVFLDLVGFGILIPIQPFYAELLGARPTTVTLLSASYSLMQFVFAPLIGRVSDRVGRRPVMLATIAVNAIGYALFGLAQSLPMLFLARITSGLGSANLGTAQAVVADLTTPETRAQGMGLIGAAFGLGFVLGPAIGGLFGQLGLAVPAFVAAALSTANLVNAWYRLPETRQIRAASDEADGIGSGPRTQRPAGLPLQALRGALRHADVPQLLWLALVGTVGFSLMEQVLGLYIERTWAGPSGSGAGREPLRQAAALTAYFLVVVGVALAVVQGALIGPLVRRFSERRLLPAGTLITAVGIGILPMVGGWQVFPLFLLLGPVIALGSGITQPAASSLLSQAAGRAELGGTLGLGQSLSALGRVIGPSVAGALFEVGHGVPFLVGSALTLSCTVAVLTLTPSAAARAQP